MDTKLPFTVICAGLSPLSFTMVSGFLVADLPNPGSHNMITFSLTEAIPDDKSRSLN